VLHTASNPENKEKIAKIKKAGDFMLPAFLF
jgi:hypothetical protein